MAEGKNCPIGKTAKESKDCAYSHKGVKTQLGKVQPQIPGAVKPHCTHLGHPHACVYRKNVGIQSEW